MTCRDLAEFLIDYLDGDLPAEQRLVFETHLRRCPPCEAYLRTYEATIRITKLVHTETCPEKGHTCPEELVLAILAASRNPTLRSEPEA